MSARRWVYTARLVPLDVPVRIPTIAGTPTQALTTFDETTFALERTSPTRIPVLVNHDRTLDVGRLARCYPEDGWWHVAFALDRDIREELRVGQPVSAGITENKWGSLFLDEVSIVPRGAVQGAQVVDRIDIGPFVQRSAAPTGRTPGDEVIHGGGIIRRPTGKILAVTDEYGHRLEFA